MILLFVFSMRLCLNPAAGLVRMPTLEDFSTLRFRRQPTLNMGEVRVAAPDLCGSGYDFTENYTMGPA